MLLGPVSPGNCRFFDMNISFITNKVPFPPDKGERIRSYNLLKAASSFAQVSLYSLCSAGEEQGSARAELDKLCAKVSFYPICPYVSASRMCLSLFTGSPLTFAYFHSSDMLADIKKAVISGEADAVFAYCSSSARYAMDLGNVPRVVDFVDVDSFKWEEYSRVSRFPLSLIYGLEAKRLREAEKTMLSEFSRSIVTTEKEKEKLVSIFTPSEPKASVIPNGVDVPYFSRPGEGGYEAEAGAIVFTGQMDYMPNVDAAVYFYNEVLPKIRERFPAARFRIVGRAPSPKLQATCRDAEITGYVPDIRPYLWSSAVYVAPLRISYGVPNKVLEAMAAGVPVVATSRAVQGIRVEKGKDVLVADTPGEMAEKIVSLLENSALREEMSRRAKEYVLKEHDWDATGHKLKDIFSEIKAE